MVNLPTFSLGGILLALAVTGCSSVPRATENGSIKNLWEKISTNEVIRVRGVGAVSSETKGLTARRGLSRNAALVDARFNLLAIIKGVRISAGVTIAQLAERDSLVRELANDLVRGGDEVLTEWTKDSGCVITLELRRATVERLIQEKSEREKGLEKRIVRDIQEIQKLNRLLAVAVHSDVVSVDPDEVVAVREKAEAVADIQRKHEALKARIDAGEFVSMQEIVAFANDLASAQAMDPKQMAKDTKWARADGQHITSQKEGDGLEHGLFQTGYYNPERVRMRNPYVTDQVAQATYEAARKREAAYQVTYGAANKAADEAEASLHSVHGAAATDVLSMSAADLAEYLHSGTTLSITK